MTPAEVKKAIRKADPKVLYEWLLLVDTLQDLKDQGRLRRVGWRLRDLRPATALSTLIREWKFLFGHQTDQVRRLLKGYAGQIAKHQGRIQVRTLNQKWVGETWVDA